MVMVADDTRHLGDSRKLATMTDLARKLLPRSVARSPGSTGICRRARAAPLPFPRRFLHESITSVNVLCVFASLPSSGRRHDSPRKRFLRTDCAKYEE